LGGKVGIDIVNEGMAVGCGEGRALGTMESIKDIERNEKTCDCATDGAVVGMAPTSGNSSRISSW